MESGETLIWFGGGSVGYLWRSFVAREFPLISEASLYDGMVRFVMRTVFLFVFLEVCCFHFENSFTTA
jgi:hypothetical protein